VVLRNKKETSRTCRLVLREENCFETERTILLLKVFFWHPKMVVSPFLTSLHPPSPRAWGVRAMGGGINLNKQSYVRRTPAKQLPLRACSRISSNLSLQVDLFQARCHRLIKISTLHAELLATWFTEFFIMFGGDCRNKLNNMKKKYRPMFTKQTKEQTDDF